MRIRSVGLRTWIAIVAVILVAVSMAWVVVDGWGAVRAHRWEADPWLLVAGALVIGLSYVVGAAGYVAIVEGVVDRGTPRLRLGWIWMLSLLGRYVPGSVVMVAGRVELSRDHGIPRRATAAAMVYEQALSISVASVAGAAFVTLVDGVGPAWLPWLLVPVPLVLFALMHPRVMRGLANRLLVRLHRAPLEVVLPVRRVLVLAGWFVVIQATVGLGAWLVVRGMGGPEVGSVLYVGGAYLAAYALASLAVVVPSGLGIRDGVLALAFAQHVPGSVAVALSVTVRLAFTLVELAMVGGLALVVRRR
ncbi:MAG: flippase-like domain-containing protein [Actinobacteria bacterium]|nr:flippase-like domain-containing protein [Thermoleophilia bacterium]MCB9011639.1 flippase-like domain-containing protein [Actinomycetota bacterium]